MQQRTLVVSRSAALVWTATVLAFLPAVSQALGIGDLKLQSALSEPFRAEIELTSVGPKDLKTLKANLVSPADVSAAGFSRTTPITRQLAVRIANQPEGRHVLQLYSDQSIREPYVHFLLQLDWAGGRLTREFTTLLDPRQGASEADTPVTEGQSPTNTDAPAPIVTQPSATVAATPMGAPSVAATAKPETSTAVDTEATETKTVQTPEPEEKSTHPAVSADKERERLASEIKTWAQTRTHAPAHTQEPETDAAEPAATTRAPPSPSAQNRTADLRHRIAAREHANARAAQQPQQRQPIPRGWLGEHSDELLMAAVALVALLLVGFGTAWLMLTWRPQPTPSIKPLPANQAPTIVVEKRQRGGRRRQFIPVAIERRRGPRRQSDLPQPALEPIDAQEAASEPPSQEDAVERALREEINKQPTRLGLKLKLLAHYHSRNDRDSFETLLNNIYASAESEATPDEEDWPRFEDYDELGASDGAAPVLTSVNPPQADDDAAKTEKHSDANDDAPDPTLLVPEYPLLMDEQSWTDIDSELLDLRNAVVEYEPPQLDKLGVDQAEATDGGEPDDEALFFKAEDTGDFEHEALHADDLSNVRKIVEQGMTMITGENGDQEGMPSAKRRGSKKGRKRKRKARASGKSDELAKETHDRGPQWRDPAMKIDLAKAYIDMGDAERARHILDELLQHWHRGEGAN
jgi:hypothetical protein